MEPLVQTETEYADGCSGEPDGEGSPDGETDRATDQHDGGTRDDGAVGQRLEPAEHHEPRVARVLVVRPMRPGRVEGQRPESTGLAVQDVGVDDPLHEREEQHHHGHGAQIGQADRRHGQPSGHDHDAEEHERSP